MHADEQPTYSAREDLKHQRYTNDIEGLIAEYETLVASYQSLLGRSARDAQNLSALRAEIQKVKVESARLRTDLRASKEENLRLRKSLTALRHSLSLRAGKALTLPVRELRKTVRGLRRRPQPEPTPVASKPHDQGRSVSGDAETPLNPPELGEQYLAQVRKDPTAANVMRAVSHAFYVQGEIREPAKLLREYEAVLGSLADKAQTTRDSVLGLDRLLTKLPSVPPKQPNSGYLVERNRILYCAHSTGGFNSNGYSTRTAEVARGLMASGLEILVAARPGYPWDVPVDKPAPAKHRFSRQIYGVEHVYNPGPSWKQQPLDRYWIEATDIYVREAQKARVAAIHSASNHVTALPALIAARRLGVPFTYEVRGLWEITGASDKPGWDKSERYRQAEQLETLVATSADLVFAITEQVKDELIRRGVNPVKIKLLPNGVDTDRFAPMPPSPLVKARLNLSAGIPVVGYAGSLVQYEGISDLIDALALLKDAGTAFRAVIVGDGPELGNLRRRATALGLSELVHFTGRVGASEVPEYVSTFDIMPCPRIRLPVTELVSPLKPLEAMAAGKAMVLSDLAPLRTFAGQDEQRALLAQPSDPKSLASSLQILLVNPDLRKDIGVRARLWAVASRQWTIIGRTAGHALQDVIKDNEAGVAIGRPLSSMTVGIIADAFTTEGLRPEVNLLEILPGSWRHQLEEHRLDALFVESAWEGSARLWHQKVGYYDDERFRDLRELLEFCNAKGIPTIFWNKEDPVHFNRFQATATLFDHVFTTDANCIPRYARSSGNRTQTIGSLPFYAQPALHNPLPTDRTYSPTVAYAGSYYGDRFPGRSRELASLLEAARPHGLSIYDRQHLNPESPYKFPENLAPFVVGGLPYLEMVKAYKAHPVHINVNSVDNSPTMFSRRVVELAASGTTVLSGKGEGVDQVLAGLVPTVGNGDEASLLLNRWMTNEAARLDDAWLGYRLVHRAHTAAHRMAYVLRCAGLVVEAPRYPRYAVKVGRMTAATLKHLEAQTVRPSVVITSEFPADSPLMCLNETEATPEKLAGMGVQWVGTLPSAAVDRTIAEDLLSGTRFGAWSELGAAPIERGSLPKFAEVGPASAGAPSMVSLHPEDGQGKGLVFRRNLNSTARGVEESRAQTKALRILVAGHDLKFAGDIVKAMVDAGHKVAIDQWHGHNQHDEERSLRLLAEADVVFCEWTLGNAAWYSANLLPHQRLVTRFHSQELFTPYLKDLKTARIDKVIFVGRHVADLAIRDHGIPKSKAVVIPNIVRRGAQTKDPGARFRIGMVGIVPAQKHFDRALDLLRMLRSEDPRYELRIKGKRPEDYPWMANRQDEMAFYSEQYERLASDPLLKGSVHFDGHDDRMAQWYQTVGVVLSLSDFESFHLTLADGAASGSIPASLAWPGADQIYPVDWIHPGLKEMAAYIFTATSTEEQWRAASSTAHKWAEDTFKEPVILGQILGTITGDKTL